MDPSTKENILADDVRQIIIVPGVNEKTGRNPVFS
jgi:hypothetical protein